MGVASEYGSVPVPVGSSLEEDGQVEDAISSRRLAHVLSGPLQIHARNGGGGGSVRSQGARAPGLGRGFGSGRGGEEWGHRGTQNCTGKCSDIKQCGGEPGKAEEMGI